MQRCHVGQSRSHGKETGVSTSTLRRWKRMILVQTDSSSNDKFEQVQAVYDF